MNEDKSFIVTGVSPENEAIIYTGKTLKAALILYGKLIHVDYMFVRLSKELEVKETVVYKLA